MKKNFFKKGVAAALSALLLVGFACIAGCNSENNEKNSFTFRESVETISNPGVGYTSTDWYHTKPGETLVHDTQGNIVLFFVDLGPFSAGVNGTKDEEGNYIEGVDYDLDESFFKALRGTFENCRKGGSCFALRFRYDELGKGNPEPKTFEQVLKHISQIKESGILEEYKDILMFVESGFVGAWGEQHGGKYTSTEYKAKLLKALLDCVPAPIPVTVRTADTFARYVGIDRKELADYFCEEGSDAARVGLFNDGYMGSDSDLGTYANRDIETTWLNNQTLTSYFGGEFSGNIDFAKKFDTYLPENCIPEMYKTHLSYINGNIFQLYKDYTFSKKYDVEGYDNSAYYGQSVFQFIRDHLGYRFVLKESTLSAEVKQGGTLDLSFSLVNNGFANPVKQQTCEVLLEKDGNFVATEVDLDPTKWYSGKTVTSNLQLNLPGNLEAGRWNVYFKSYIGKQEMTNYACRSIRFANQDVWNATLGANKLGYFDITETSSYARTDNTFGEAGKETAAHLYNLNGRVRVDGIIDEGEWTENDLVAKNEAGNSLYVKADENYIYFMSDIPHRSGAPVFNLRAKNSDNNQSYWLYQGPGVFYFTHEKDTGRVGIRMEYSDKLFETRLPLKMLGIKDGTRLSEISVFIQDRADEWKGKGSVGTKQEYFVKTEAGVFNAGEKVIARRGGEYSVTIETDSTVKNIVWLKDGVQLENTSPTLELTDLKNSDEGVYSVRITTDKDTVIRKEILDLTII